MRILLIVPCLCSILSHAQQSTTTNPNTPSAAVMPLSGQGIDATSSTIVTDALVDELMKTGSVRMMERSQMEAILKEQGFQQSGACDGSECAVQIGKLLSIDRVFIGSLGRLGSSYTISVRIVNIETGEIIGSARRQQRGEIDDITTTLVPAVSQELVQILDSKKQTRASAALATNSSSVDTAREAVAAAAPLPAPISAPPPPKQPSTPVAAAKSSQPAPGPARARLFLGFSAGATYPGISLTTGDEAVVTEVTGSSATLEAGLRVPLGKNVELDASIGYTLVEGGIKIDESLIESSDYATYTSTSHIEATVKPELVDIKSTVSFLATTRFAVGGGAVFSIPVGGDFTAQSNYSYRSDCINVTCTEYDESGSNDTSGSIESILKQSFDTSPKSFISAEIHGRFRITSHFVVSASGLIPLGAYIEEKDNSVKWSRVLLSIEYVFGNPANTGSTSLGIPRGAALAAAL